MTKKRKRAIDADIIRELAILGHLYQVLSNTNGEKALFLEHLEYKLSNIINNYSRYWELSEQFFQKRWKGIDEKSREGTYYYLAYAIHMLMLYKYDYMNKKIGKGLMAGVKEQDFLDVLTEMKEHVSQEDIERSIQFAEKVYNKLTTKN